MALIQTEVKLSDIGQTLDVNIFFPTDRSEAPGRINGVITLLHGMGNTGYDWMTMTSAPRYAAENGYILVAPEAGNSFYQDMRYGALWYTAITELLPQQLENIYNIPKDRAVNFVAGNSMGGYGALRFGLLHPERYAAAASFSGALELSRMNRYLVDEMMALPLVEGIWGAEGEIPQDADLLYLAGEAAKLPPAQQPRLLCTCGLQDTTPGDILAHNRAFAGEMAKLPLDFSLYTWNGVHEWNFWDRSLAIFIEFIQSSDYGEQKTKAWAEPMAAPQGGKGNGFT